MAVLFLPAASLILMLMRVWLPYGQKPSGQPLGEISLTWRERLLMQRTNLYALGGILLLLAITKVLPYVFEVIALALAYGILMIPLRYRFTSDGVGLNNVVFRRWEEFSDFTAETRSVRLLGEAGMRDFHIKLLAGHQDSAIAIVHRCLPSQVALDKGRGAAASLKKTKPRHLAAKS